MNGKIITIILALLAFSNSNAGIKDRLEGSLTYNEHLFVCDVPGTWADTKIIIRVSSDNTIKGLVKVPLASFSHVNIIELDEDYIVLQDEYNYKYYIPTHDGDAYYIAKGKNSKSEEMSCTRTVNTGK